MNVAFFLALSASVASGAYDVFPVKSINLASADSVSFYVARSLTGIEDAHAVAGIETSDGGFVLVGKAAECESCANIEAFAVKFSSSGAYQWSWRSQHLNADDGALSTAQLATGDILVVGYRNVGGTFRRAITRLADATGVEAWTALWGVGSTHGAWESIEVTASGDGVLLAGLTNSNDASEFWFKSYGNVIDGQALVSKVPLAALSGSSAPVEAAVAQQLGAWSYTATSYMTCKAALPAGTSSSGAVVALLYSEWEQATLVLLDESNGGVRWGPNDFGSAHGEGTAVAVAADGSGFVISGHGDGGVSGALSGRLSKVSAAGAYEWSRSYSVGGTPALIFNECWGVQASSDGGFILACGAGIEECHDGQSAQLRQDCLAGRGDTRPGAVPRPAGVWHSLVVRTSSTGAVLWQRVDQHLDATDPALGQPGWHAASSASEWVVKCADGGFAFVQDETRGVGLMKLAPSATSGPPASPPASPPSSPPPACPPAASAATCALSGAQAGRQCACQYVWEDGCPQPTATLLTCA